MNQGPIFHDDFDGEPLGWHPVHNTWQTWSTPHGATSCYRVDDPGTGEGSHLLRSLGPTAFTGNYRVRVELMVADPEHSSRPSTVDLLLCADGPDDSYLVQLRVRDGVPYVTLTKRVSGDDEVLIDDLLSFDFERWISLEVTFEDGRFGIDFDGRRVAECNEFDPLTGPGLGIGARGATVRFGAIDLHAGPADVAGSGQVRKVPAPPYDRDRDTRRSVGVLENSLYRLEFFAVDAEVGLAHVVELAVRAGHEWVPVRMDDRWLLFSGDRGSRRNLYASMACTAVRFDQIEPVDPRTIRLRAAEADDVELVVTWSLTDREPRVTCGLTSRAEGNHVIGYQGFSARPPECVDEVLCGPLQHAKMVRGVESIGAAELSAPMNLVQYSENQRPLTVGLFVAATELPLVYEPTSDDDDQPFGMSLRNQDGNVQPILFAPQYGKRSVTRPGETRTFEFGLYAAAVELFEGYRHLLRTEHDYRPYRQNVFGSLTDTVHNLIDLLTSDPEQDDTVNYRSSPSGWWSRAKNYIDIENDQAVRATATGVLLSAYYLTGDERIYERRARPIIEFSVSRNAYGWTPVRGKTVYGVSGRSEVCSVPFGTPALAPLYTMTGGRIPVLRHLALEGSDNEDYWLKRTPISTPLAAYRMTGDPAMLSRATDLARDYVAREIDPPYTENVDPHDFANYYVKAWTELLEVYEATGDPDLLRAAHVEARRFVTQLFVRPVPEGNVQVPSRPLVRDRQIELSGWWDPDELYAYPRDDIPDEEVPAWVVSPTGMGFEAFKTYRYNGFSMNPAWAPFLLRLADHVNDDLLRDAAHNAIVGRFTNYPGYYYRQFTVHHMRPDFPYHGPFWNTTIYYHHAPAQLGMTLDYLLTEQQVRSEGKIAFPAEFEQNYVWFAYRLYGHRPGHFFGYDDVRLWMPRGLVRFDNEQINWIAGEDGDRLFVGLCNESERIEQVRLDFGPEFIRSAPGEPPRVEAFTKDAEPLVTDLAPEVSASGSFGVTVAVPPRGLTALVVHGAGPFDRPLPRTVEHTEQPMSSYHLADNTPIGPVWGMVMLSPGGDRYDVYVQAATHRPATLHYSTNPSRGFESVERAVHPAEWTIPVHDPTARFTYYVEVDGVATEPVELAWS